MTPRKEKRDKNSPYRLWLDCKSKTRFPDEYSAQRKATRWQQHIYQCPHCYGWHTTKIPRKTKPMQVAQKRDLTDVERAQLRVKEATRIMNQLLVLKRKGVELPAAIITKAQEHVEGVRDDLEAIAKRSP